MSYKNNLIYNTLELPAYWWSTWRRKKQLQKEWVTEKINYGKHPRQYALRVRHKDWVASEVRATAIYFHGGAWTFGSPEQFLPAARLFIEAGYEVVMPSYRRLPLHTFSDIYTDMKLMRDELLQATSVVVVAGMSAGGHLAASIGWRSAFWSEAGLELPQKLILCGAVIDLNRMNLAPGLRLLGGKRGSATFQFANPAHVFTQSEILPERQLFVHGTADGTASFDQTHCFYVSHQSDHPGMEHLWIDNGTHLDSCRWMYRNDAVAERIQEFLAALP